MPDLKRKKKKLGIFLYLAGLPASPSAPSCPERMALCNEDLERTLGQRVADRPSRGSLPLPQATVCRSDRGGLQFPLALGRRGPMVGSAPAVPSVLQGCGPCTTPSAGSPGCPGMGPVRPGPLETRLEAWRLPPGAYGQLFHRAGLQVGGQWDSGERTPIPVASACYGHPKVQNLVPHQQYP